MTSLAERFREHAQVCDRLAAPLYATLSRAMAEDFDAGGPVRLICRGWEDAPASALVPLRLLASLHLRVLSGREPTLAGYYPNVGGWQHPRGAWSAARAVLAAEVDQISAELAQPPQTNEVGRAGALLVGLTHLVRHTGLHQLRLLELGASAGLNLQIDRFHFSGAGWQWGPEASAVDLGGLIEGPFHPVDFELVQRRGCDLNPLDPSSEEGWLRVRSYVWPDHLERNARVLQALKMAGRTDWAVDRAAAGEWTQRMLTQDEDADVLSVVWHSVLWQYLPADERARVEAVVAEAARRRPVAHLRMEPQQPDAPGHSFQLRVTTYTGGDAVDVVLADVGPHGDPVIIAS